MIGSYGRNAYGGRAGGTKNNKNIHTISPKGGSLEVARSIGSLKVARSIGSLKVRGNLGSSKRS